MVGLTGTRVIPAGWESRHRPILETSMTGLCQVVRPGPPGDYPDFEDSPDTVLADTTCRVQQQNRAGRVDAQGQLVDTRDYLVALPADAWPVGTVVDDQGPHVIVTGYQAGHAGDPDLIGRRLRVTQVLHGTLRFERDLMCVLDLTESGGTA